MVARSWGHDIVTTKLTFSREISRIFAAHCWSCHGEGSQIPLTNYAEARPWAVSIKEQVLSRKMPPCGAVKGFGYLWPDRSLSEEDIQLIAAWVVGGAPAGNAKLMPKYSPTIKAVPEILMRDALVVDTQTELSKPLKILGVRPLASGSVENARITAVLPSGDIFPLVWLYQFDATCERVFTFRGPVDMPTGSVIRSSAPLRFALLEAVKSNRRAR
jgi:hypothetical protein